MMLHRRSCLVIILSISVLLIAASSAATPSNSNCSLHHSGPQPSGGYTYIEPTLSFAGPEFVPPNSTFVVRFIVSTPGRYQVLNATATIGVTGEGELSSSEQPKKTMPNIPDAGGSSTTNWTLKTNSLVGTILTTVNLNFTEYHRHGSASNSDYSQSTLSASHRITVRTAGIQLSESRLAFQIGERNSTKFDIVANSQVKNITLTKSPNLNGLIDMTPRNIPNLAAGENVTVSVSFNGNQSVVDNGRINIIWTDADGKMDSAYVTVRLWETQNASQTDTSILKWTGRITGFTSLGLLFASVGLGMIKIGKERRRRLHCAISWFLLALSSYHGIVLLIGPYSTLAVATNILMGYASTIAMGIVSVNGLVEKWMTNATNHSTWLWMHRGFIIIGIVFGLAHGVLMGTDFAIVRKLFGV